MRPEPAAKECQRERVDTDLSADSAGGTAPPEGPEGQYGPSQLEWQSANGLVDVELIRAMVGEGRNLQSEFKGKMNFVNVVSKDFVVVPVESNDTELTADGALRCGGTIDGAENCGDGNVSDDLETEPVFVGENDGIGPGEDHWGKVMTCTESERGVEPRPEFVFRYESLERVERARTFRASTWGSTPSLGRATTAPTARPSTGGSRRTSCSCSRSDGLGARRPDLSRTSRGEVQFSSSLQIGNRSARPSGGLVLNFKCCICMLSHFLRT